MARRYGMDEGLTVAKQAAQDIERWLRNLPQTLAVENVEDDVRYQRIDVDLLWTTQKRTYKVEVKGDRWETTGNFFFETYSNEEQNTPGCFLYTEADLLFYYFVNSHNLYILPMPKTRAWFLKNIREFVEKRTTTPVGKAHYTTVGRLVPIARVFQEVDDVVQCRL